MNITSKYEFYQASSTLSGRMVSLDAETRFLAAASATELLADLPKHLKNSPHIKNEVAALEKLISRVVSE